MNRKFSTLIAVVSISLLSHFNSYGWGKEGHQMVGLVAGKYMKSQTLEMVTKYLGGITLDSAATWMDDVRNDPKYKYLAPWHFVNIEKGKTYAAKPTDVNCINEINNAYKSLKNRNKLSDDEIRYNLFILFHLWGDLHQPLHAGYASDKGGNLVTLKFSTKPTNLHSLWDGGIIRDRRIKLNNCLARYKTLSPAQIAELKKFDNIAAMKQSQALLEQVYNFKDGMVDDAYAKLNQPVIERQILCGGIRLAAMLDDIFKK